MNQRTVRRLEQELEEAIAGILDEVGRHELTVFPSRQTLHLMAKAAVTVYEAAVENHQASKV